MNKAQRVPDYLGHILEAIERVGSYTADIDEPTFLSNQLIQDAVIRNIGVVGEAANNIQRADPAFAERHSEIPWLLMYTMRNRLMHGYDTIDLEIVWKTIQEDLPNLYRLVKAAQS